MKNKKWKNEKGKKLDIKMDEERNIFIAKHKKM